MKNRLFKTSAQLLGLVVASVLQAQPASAPAAKPPVAANVETKSADTTTTVSSARLGESRELADAKAQLELFQNELGDNHPTIKAQKAKIAMLEKLEPRRFNIDFPGGNLSNLLYTIGKTEGLSLSIINADKTDSALVDLPRFSIRNVNLSTLTGIIRSLLPKEFSLDQVGQMDANSVVCILHRRDDPPVKYAMEEMQNSFQLAPYLSEQSVDDIMGAIRAAWELDPKRDKNALRLKYHPPTSILLVSGTTQGVAITQGVLKNLKQSPNPRPADQDTARRKAPPPDKP